MKARDLKNGDKFIFVKPIFQGNKMLKDGSSPLCVVTKQLGSLKDPESGTALVLFVAVSIEMPPDEDVVKVIS